jgi:hypothetical protein
VVGVAAVERILRINGGLCFLSHLYIFRLVEPPGKLLEIRNAIKLKNWTDPIFSTFSIAIPSAHGSSRKAEFGSSELIIGRTESWLLVRCSSAKNGVSAEDPVSEGINSTVTGVVSFRKFEISISAYLSTGALSLEI